MLSDIQKTNACFLKGFKDEFTDAYELINEEVLKKEPSTVTNTKVVGSKIVNEHTPVDMGNGNAMKVTHCGPKKAPLNENKTRAKFEEILRPQIEKTHTSNDNKELLIKATAEKMLDECRGESKPYVQTLITLSDEFKELVHDLVLIMVERGIEAVELRKSILEVTKKARVKKQKN